MPREQVRVIASRGGKAAHEKGTAHEFTAEEARVHGRKGGEATRATWAARRAAKAEVEGGGEEPGNDAA